LRVYQSVTYNGAMHAPLFVRPLTAEERQALEAGLRSADAFTVRRSQILLKSAEGLTVHQIKDQLGWSDQCAREAIHAFHKEGIACLAPKSKRPKSVRKCLGDADLLQLQEWLRQSPRDFGLPTSRWTLSGIAVVCAAKGLTPRRVSDETIRDAMKRLGLKWQRAKRWIESRDPAYARKRGRAIG
jgi:transposase